MSNPNKNAVDLINLIKDKFAMRKDIAPVETSSTASRAYKVGDKFYYGNLLQKATQDIAQGTGLAGGVNFENADPVTEQVTSLKETLTNQINKNGAKNLLVTPYINLIKGTNVDAGVTFTENKDGSVRLKGSRTGSAIGIQLHGRVAQYDPLWLKPGTYIASRGGNYGSNVELIICTTKNNAYSAIGISTDNELEFTITSSTSDYVDENGNVLIGVYVYVDSPLNTSIDYTIYPMIRLASDPDGTYEPYAMTNQELTTDKVGMDLLGEVGAVNLFEYPYSDSTKVISNITYTDNGDGSITVNAGTVSSGGSSFFTFDNLTKRIQKFRNKTIKVVVDGVGTINGNNTKFEFIVFDSSDNALLSFNLYPSNNRVEKIVTIPSNADHAYIQCWNKKGETITAYTWKPMIVPVEYNGEFVPYAKSNRELTEDVETLKSGQLNGSVKVFGQVDMNVFCTSDAIPSDFNNLTTQQATDFAQAMYDLLKKLGSGVFFMGILTVKYLKKSDGTFLGSGKGFATIYTNATYNNMLSNNSNARMSVNVQSYGNSIFTQYGLWGSTLTYLETGVNAANLNVNDRWKGSYNTISTYKG